MPRYDDEYDAEYDYDPDDPETYPEGLYADNSRDTVPCRHCSAEIDEDAEQCPKCGYYVTGEEPAPGKRSAFWVVLMVLAMVCAAMWATGR